MTVLQFLKKQKTTIDLDSEFLPLKKIIELYGEDMSYLELFLQYHSDKIYEDALMDAVHWGSHPCSGSSYLIKIYLFQKRQ